MGFRARVELRYERVGKSVISVAKKAEKCQQMNFMAEKKSWFCDLFIFLFYSLHLQELKRDAKF